MTLTEQAIATIAAGCEGVTEGRVKPLEWKKSDPRNRGGYCYTPFGLYRAWTDHEAAGRWFWGLRPLYGPHIAEGECASETEATAAAEADYEQRALALIAPPALSPATVLALCALAQEALQSRREGQQMREATIEECAEVAEAWHSVIPMWDRPGGPPGNGPARAGTPDEIAKAIRALSHPKPESVKS